MFQRLQALDSGLQFHAIVGGLRFRTKHFAALVAITKNASPAARARIADTRPVRYQLDFFHRPIRRRRFPVPVGKKHQPVPGFVLRPRSYRFPLAAWNPFERRAWTRWRTG